MVKERKASRAMTSKFDRFNQPVAQIKDRAGINRDWFIVREIARELEMAAAPAELIAER